MDHFIRYTVNYDLSFSIDIQLNSPPIQTCCVIYLPSQGHFTCRPPTNFFIAAYRVFDPEISSRMVSRSEYILHTNSEYFGINLCWWLSNKSHPLVMFNTSPENFFLQNTAIKVFQKEKYLKVRMVRLNQICDITELTVQ